MFRSYAIFSKNNPMLHSLVLVIVFSVMFFSIYQLIENEALVYGFGILFCLLCSILFAKSSKYSRQYLN